MTFVSGLTEMMRVSKIFSSKAPGAGEASRIACTRSRSVLVGSDMMALRMRALSFQNLSSIAFDL